MTIELTEKDVKDLIVSLEDDVNYKMYESGCEDEYELQIASYLKLLHKLKTQW